ncbi:hypothetical protein EPO15_10885 [bacterium]|nr:MAG: hypothetical protein EPO15_10885 [bacterium]
MRPLFLALTLALPSGAAKPAASDPPADEALFKEFELKESYRAMRELRPRIDALKKEVSAWRDSHAGKVEMDPGGAARKKAHDELYELRHELYRRRDSFHKMGVDLRASGTVKIVFAFKEGNSDEANKIVQAGLRHNDIVAESKVYEQGIETVLDQEVQAYDAAVERWRELERARTFRRRAALGAGAAVALLPAAVLLWRRRPQAALEGPAPAGGRLGRWGLGKAAKPWTYGSRWDGADGGGGTTASVRLFDERLCASPERLLAALKAAAPPKHPGSPLEAFAAGTSVVLAYPAAHGKPLSKWLEEGRAVPPAQVVLFLKRLAPLFDAAHRAGRAHGGLAPDCVLVGADGTVVVEDFGVAVALAAAGVKAAPFPAYSAPETEAGAPAPAADLYSLGVMVYELLTGRHPFEGTNLPVMKREKRYTPLAAAAPACPPALGALVDGLLEPEPAHRRPRPGGLEKAVTALG